MFPPRRSSIKRTTLSLPGRPRARGTRCRECLAVSIGAGQLKGVMSRHKELCLAPLSRAHRSRLVINARELLAGVPACSADLTPTGTDRLIVDRNLRVVAKRFPCRSFSAHYKCATLLDKRSLSLEPNLQGACNISNFEFDCFL